MGEHTVNPIIGETNDSIVNNMWADPVQSKQVFEALDNASGGTLTMNGAPVGRELGTYSCRKATTVSSARGTLKAIPIHELTRILEKHQVLGWDKSQRP